MGRGLRSGIARKQQKMEQLEQRLLEKKLGKSTNPPHATPASDKKVVKKAKLMAKKKKVSFGAVETRSPGPTELDRLAALTEAKLKNERRVKKDTKEKNREKRKKDEEKQEADGKKKGEAKKKRQETNRKKKEQEDHKENLK